VSERPEVLIAGGGIAGLEALMAVRDLAGERVWLTLAARDPMALDPHASQTLD
jgi:hypothetical protein